MRILWISHLVPYPPKGGVLQRSYHLLREAARRHDVHLLALWQDSMHPGRERAEAAASHLDFCRSVEIFPIPAERTRFHWWAMTLGSYLHPLPYDVNWLRSTRLRQRVGGLTRERAFDLVHLDTLGLAPYGDDLTGGALVLNHHNVESDVMSKRAERADGTLRRAYFRREAKKLARFERRACPTADVNVVVSPLDSRRLRDNVGDIPTEIVENGVDVEYFRPTREPGSESEGLIFVGGMTFYANRDAVLFFLREVWPLLQDDDPTRTMTFVGRDPPAEVREACRRGNVSAPGFVDDVRPYMDAAGIYVCPIRTGGGTRLKVLDALAMAKPLVATTFAVEGLDLTDGEHFLRADTPVGFVRQICRLEENAELRRRIARAGRRLVERRYAWNVVGDHLERAYQKAVAERRWKTGQPVGSAGPTSA